MGGRLSRPEMTQITPCTRQTCIPPAGPLHSQQFLPGINMESLTESLWPGSLMGNCSWLTPVGSSSVRQTEATADNCSRHQESSQKMWQIVPQQTPSCLPGSCRANTRYGLQTSQEQTPGN